MKTVTITKDDVLTAIETEPLTAGKWMSFDKCSACVVGGTLRRKLKCDPRVPGFSFYRFSEMCEAATNSHYLPWEKADSGHWLSALSIVWEYMNNQNEDASPEDLRWNIWEWAEENIPDEWEYELVVSQGGVA